MIKKLLLLFIVATLLIGCGPVTPVIPAPTITPVVPTSTATQSPKTEIVFREPNFFGDPNNYGFDLNLGIYAINKDLVFLIGSINDRQSTLLRSADGGKSWQEIMDPILGSAVIDFYMFENGEGWAETAWVIETAGGYTIWHTTDFGETWTELSKIPTNGSPASTAGLNFVDNKNGQIAVCSYGVSQISLDFLTTEDGGVSWDKTSSYVTPFEPVTNGYAIADLYQQLHTDFSNSFGKDGSQWRIEDYKGNIIVSMRSRNEKDYSLSDWSIVTVIPKQLKYQDGQIIIP